MGRWVDRCFVNGVSDAEWLRASKAGNSDSIGASKIGVAEQLGIALHLALLGLTRYSTGVAAFIVCWTRYST